MEFKITGSDGSNVNNSIVKILNVIVSRLKNSGKTIQQALLHTTKNHFTTIYPASNHYSPEKVSEGDIDGSSGEIIIDVPGITRAYKDLHITPKYKKRLTIPLHTEAYGKKASTFSNLFFIKKKNGKEFLAKKSGNGIAFMYYLAKEVHQQRDPRLMPSDKTFADNIFARIKASLNNSKI